MPEDLRWCATRSTWPFHSLHAWRLVSTCIQCVMTARQWFVSFAMVSVSGCGIRFRFHFAGGRNSGEFKLKNHVIGNDWRRLRIGILIVSTQLDHFPHFHAREKTSAGVPDVHCVLFDWFTIIFFHFHVGNYFRTTAATTKKSAIY